MPEYDLLLAVMTFQNDMSSSQIHDKSMFKEMQELVFNRKLINVNDLERKSVIKLVQATWNSKLVGVGKDGAHLRHKNIEVSRQSQDCPKT